MKPQRIQLSRKRGFNLQKYSRELNGLPAVNCARPAKWGNPFIVGRDGTRAQCVDLFQKLLAGYVCLSTGAHIKEQETLRCAVIRYLDELRGKNLACWCRLDGKPCHADVLLQIANQ